MKVVKFGGSSLASATQLEKVFNIVKEDEARQYVVVSAPGKRNAEDTKVTDALIKYYKEYTNGKDTNQSQEWIINRYRSITEELDLDEEIIEEIARDIKSLATLPKSDNTFLYDTFLAAGENNNAKLIAAYFVKKGYAEELQESDLTLDSLEEKLSHLLSHKEDYQAKMRASKELKSLADFYQLLKKDLS